MNDNTILDIYQVQLSLEDMIPAKKEVWILLGLTVFFVLIALLMGFVSYNDFQKFFLGKTDSWDGLFSVIPLAISIALVVAFYRWHKNSSTEVKERKGLHFEGTVLATYESGRGMNFFVVMGNYSFPISKEFRGEIKPGDHLCIVTIGENYKKDSQTPIRYFSVDESSEYQKQTSGRIRKLYSLSKDDPMAYEKNPYKNRIIDNPFY